MNLKNAIFFALTLAFTSCDKSETAKHAEALPVTAIIKNGTWVMTYTEGGINIDLGTTNATFSDGGKVVITKNATTYNGTWKEMKTESVHTLALNINTDDTALFRVNGSWKVIIATSTHIDITDPDLNKRHTVHLNK